jgi:hypothetical protein
MEQDFTYELISRKKVTHKIHPLGFLQCVSWMDYWICRNCESHQIYKLIEIRKWRKIPNPKVFGEKVKPTIFREAGNINYFCKKWGIENSSFEKIAIYIPSYFTRECSFDD